MTEINAENQMMDPEIENRRKKPWENEWFANGFMISKLISDVQSTGGNEYDWLTEILTVHADSDGDQEMVTKISGQLGSQDIASKNNPTVSYPTSNVYTNQEIKRYREGMSDALTKAENKAETESERSFLNSYKSMAEMQPKQFCRAGFESPFLGSLLPLLHDINIRRGELEAGSTNFAVGKELAEATDELLGGICDEFVFDTERQKLSDDPDTEKEEKYLDELYQKHDKIIGSYEKIMQYNEEMFDTGSYNRLCGNIWRNSFDESFGVTKGTGNINPFIGWIKGEKRAIENGWGMNELGILGLIGCVEEQLRIAKQDLNDKEKTEELNKFKKIFIKLKQKCWNAPAYTVEEKKSIAKEVSDFSMCYMNMDIGRNKFLGSGVVLNSKTNYGYAADVCRYVLELPSTEDGQEFSLNELFETAKESGSERKASVYAHAIMKELDSADIEERIAGLTEHLRTSFGNIKNIFAKDIKGNRIDHIIDENDEKTRQLWLRVYRKAAVTEAMSNHILKETAGNDPEKVQEDAPTAKTARNAQALKSILVQCFFPKNDEPQVVPEDVANVTVQQAEENSRQEMFRYGLPVRTDGCFDAVNVRSLSEYAKDKLARLDEKAGDRSTHCGEYIVMYNTLKAVSELDENNTPAEAGKAVEDMRRSAENYSVIIEQQKKLGGGAYFIEYSDEKTADILSISADIQRAVTESPDHFITSEITEAPEQTKQPDNTDTAQKEMPVKELGAAVVGIYKANDKLNTGFGASPEMEALRDAAEKAGKRLEKLFKLERVLKKNPPLIGVRNGEPIDISKNPEYLEKARTDCKSEVMKLYVKALEYEHQKKEKYDYKRKISFARFDPKWLPFTRLGKERLEGARDIVKLVETLYPEEAAKLKGTFRALETMTYTAASMSADTEFRFRFGMNRMQENDPDKKLEAPAIIMSASSLRYGLSQADDPCGFAANLTGSRLIQEITDRADRFIKNPVIQALKEKTNEEITAITEGGVKSVRHSGKKVLKQQEQQKSKSNEQETE